LVIGRVPVSRILAQEPVLDRRLAAPGAGVGLATKVPDGMRAMSVRVDDVNGVAGFVVPEARVDVLITGMPQHNPQSGRMTRTILGNVRVLSAGEHLAPDSTGRPQRVPVVTLLLTPEQSEMVTLAQTQGRIQLVLRNGKDEEVAETSGVNEGDLFGSAPKTINVSKPAPRPVYVEAPGPPPPPVQIEVLRGKELSTQTFESAHARP
jgi:pilus assembly protein CpaB